MLDRDDSVVLIAGVAGGDRIAAEPAAAARVAALCADLPLALRIAAAHLAGTPERAVASFAVELAATDRLSALRVDGDPRSAVRAAFDLSFARLSDRPRRLFRLLGLVDAPNVGAGCAARLLDDTVKDVTSTMDALAAAHLVEPAGSDRYRMHDLLRLFAREQVLADEPDAVRVEALLRVARWHLYLTSKATRLVFPGLPGSPEPAGSGSEFRSASQGSPGSKPSDRRCTRWSGRRRNCPTAGSPRRSSSSPWPTW